MGYDCDALIVRTETGETVYYYSKEIKIDPIKFREHQFGNWSLFTELANSYKNIWLAFVQIEAEMGHSFKVHAN